MLDCSPILFVETIRRLGIDLRPGRVVAPAPRLSTDDPVLDLLELVVLVHVGKILSPIPTVQRDDNSSKRRIRSPHIGLDGVPLVPLHLPTETPNLAV